MKPYARAIVTDEFTLYDHQLIDGAFIRQARKDHTCHKCRRTIEKRRAYVEYIGESPAFQSGKRFCPACARTQLTIG